MQVTRQRRTAQAGRPNRRRSRIIAIGTAAIVVSGAGVAYGATTQFGNRQVGTQYKDGLQVSDDQVLAPLGARLATKFGKFMASTPSADGRYLAATSTDKNVVLQVFDLQTYRLIYTVGSATFVNQKLADGSVGQGGPTWSPDGKFLWLPQAKGLTRFPVNADGTLGAPTTVKLATVGSAAPLPGKSVYSPDGKTLYVPVNGQNTVVALDPVTGTVQRTWKVGIAPRELAFVGHRLYVSNEGGRQAKPGETTINSYGTQVPADPYLGTSTTGSISVIDVSTPSAAVGSIAVGLHPTALYSKGKALFVANTNSDTVSVVNTATNKVVQTIATQPWPVLRRRLPADRCRSDERRPPARHPGSGQRSCGLPLLGHPARAS